MKNKSKKITEDLTPSVLLTILKENGFDTTKASIARYMQDGLVMRPLQKNTRNGNEERAYYHPLAIIEIMTAMLLFRGDFLTYKSKARIARLTCKDIFYGRLRFYTYFFYHYNISTSDFYTSLDKHPDEFQKLLMNEENTYSYLNHFEVLFDKSLELESHEQLGKAYKAFSASIYTETFEYLFQKYKKILNDFGLQNYVLQT